MLSFSILSLGTGMSMSVLAVYIVGQLHASTVAYGVTMSVAALCGMIAGPVAGRLADRAGTRRTYATLVWTMAVATALLAVATEWMALVLVCLLFSCGRGSAAVLGALVGREVPADRRVQYRAVVKTFTNLMMFVGLGLGAIVLSFDSRPLFQASFVVEALTLGTAGALMANLPSRAAAGPQDPVASAAESAPAAARRAHRDVRFLMLSAINAFILLYSAMLTVALPLWIVAQAPTLLWFVSVVVAVNLAAVLLLQIPVSKRVSGASSAVHAGRRGALLLGAGVLMFPIAEAMHGERPKAGVLIALGLLIAVGEVLYSASSWELVYALAPKEALGEYQGIYNMGLDVSMLVAPSLFAWLAGGQHTGPWLAVSAGFAACALLLGPVVGRSVGDSPGTSAGPVSESVESAL
ncbi:MAG TPA: MFS transporter [Jatrophihabitans sp.]|nr:MFS transporter [Jatrophihabitans sp.]